MGADLHLEEVLQPVVGNVVDVCVHLAVVKPFSICQTYLKIHSCIKNEPSMMPGS